MDNTPPMRLRHAVELSAFAEVVDELDRAAERSAGFAAAMDFRFLYNPNRDLFAIGFNAVNGKLDNAHYDLLASESAMTSFLCVARGDVPRKHWFQLGRPHTITAGEPGLLSWGGTMFEYLMPRLLLPTFDGTLLDTMNRAAVSRQIEYGTETKTPWGISESGYYAFDPAQNYQYQSFGVPGLGIKRGLNQALVLAPYACLMAAMIDHKAVLANLKELAALGAEGPHGYYEAIDYTSERLAKGQKFAIVRSYMAHHQGMALLALANRLTDFVMQKRLRAEPMVRAAELLLQERVATDAPVVTPADLEGAGGPVALPQPGVVQSESVRRVTTPYSVLPRTHLLSNNHYDVFVTNSGGGFSSCHGLAVTRWREDRVSDVWGSYIYVRDRETGRVWSAAHQPTCAPADSYEVTFAPDKAEFRRRDRDIETVTDVTVSPEKNAELRRVTLTNHGGSTRTLEVTSYAEIALCTRDADLSHPAFQKLFLETEKLPNAPALLCRRRPRGPEENPVFAVHVLAVEGHATDPAQYETDRAKFLGRRRSPAKPWALEPDAGELTGTVGGGARPDLLAAPARAARAGRERQRDVHDRVRRHARRGLGPGRRVPRHLRGQPGLRTGVGAQPGRAAQPGRVARGVAPVPAPRRAPGFRRPDARADPRRGAVEHPGPAGAVAARHLRRLPDPAGRRGQGRRPDARPAVGGGPLAVEEQGAALRTGCCWWTSRAAATWRTCRSTCSAWCGRPARATCSTAAAASSCAACRR